MESISKELRQAVLQAAIQGKLTKQLPEDGNASDLLKKIKTEKERLIKEKKIKKEKALESIAEDEILFDIPDSWEWCRLPDIAISELGKTLNGSKDVGLNKPYLCSINVYWNGIDLQKVKTAKFSEQDIKKYLLCKGDLLICEGGDVGRTAIWEFDDEMYYQNALHRVRFYCGVSAYYFRYLMIYYKSIGLLDDVSKGMTIKHLVQGSLYKLPIPLPPFAEQKRIVAHVEELMAKIDELEKVESELRALHQAFPNDMKSALLQAAMQGKLTEQLPEDGNNLKKYYDKHILDNDLDVPNNWAVLRLKDVASHQNGKAFKPSDWKSNGLKIIRIQNLTDINSSVNYCEPSIVEDKFIINNNDILVSWSCTIDAFKYHGKKAALNQHIFKVVFDKEIDVLPEFYVYCIKSLLSLINSQRHGSTMTHITKTDYEKLLFPLPPLAEQERIVEKLDRLLPLCDSLQIEL